MAALQMNSGTAAGKIGEARAHGPIHYFEDHGSTSRCAGGIAGVLRAFNWVQLGVNLFGQAILILPTVGALAVLQGPDHFRGRAFYGLITVGANICAPSEHASGKTRGADRSRHQTWRNP
jgi:hypothetical protein